MTVLAGKRARRLYETQVTSREDCVSVIECNPHHIAFLPERFIDASLARMAVRMGAAIDEIPRHLTRQMPATPEEPVDTYGYGPFHPA